MEKLDFSQKDVQVLSLDDLKRTIHENYSNGMPCSGIYHFQLLESLLEMLEKGGFKPYVSEIFAANNRDKYRPGVSIDERVKHEKGEWSLESLILRRIFANIEVAPTSVEGTAINMAVAYHQKGINVAFGPYVRVCHNQTILGAKDVFTTINISQAVGRLEVSKNITPMFEKIGEYIQALAERSVSMVKIVNDFKSREFEQKHMEYILFRLMEARIRHDSNASVIHSATEYPLSSSQINSAVERYLVEDSYKKPTGDNEEKYERMTWWDALNIFNFDLKPESCNIPSIIGQSYGLGDLFVNSFNADI